MNEEQLLIEYLAQVNGLKGVMRFGDHRKAVHEPVSTHMHLVSDMAQRFMEVYDLGLNYYTVMQMGTRHDFCEIEMAKTRGQDYSAFEVANNIDLQMQRDAEEEKNIEKFAKKYGARFKDIRDECEAKETREALFFEACDKIQCNVHCLPVLKSLTKRQAAFAATYPHKAIANFPELIPFYQEFQAYKKQEYLKAGKEWKDEYEFKPQKLTKCAPPLQLLLFNEYTL